MPNSAVGQGVTMAGCRQQECNESQCSAARSHSLLLHGLLSYPSTSASHWTHFFLQRGIKVLCVCRITVISMFMSSEKLLFKEGALYLSMQTPI